MVNYLVMHSDYFSTELTTVELTYGQAGLYPSPFRSADIKQVMFPKMSHNACRIFLNMGHLVTVQG